MAVAPHLASAPHQNPVVSQSLLLLLVRGVIAEDLLIYVHIELAKPYFLVVLR